MKYKLDLKPRVVKQLKKIDSKDQDKILVKVYLLAEDPYPQYSKSLKGRNDRSMRSGSYRVLYDVYEDRLVVLVLSIGHRKDVYSR
jgi:mRNA interferase RelE/StbE